VPGPLKPVQNNRLKTSSTLNQINNEDDDGNHQEQMN
jgi:hypothetical protein